MSGVYGRMDAEYYALRDARRAHFRVYFHDTFICDLLYEQHSPFYLNKGLMRGKYELTVRCIYEITADSTYRTSHWLAGADKFLKISTRGR